ncbi:sporulation protein [Planococcus sp. YIM B11945]|uniref:sporulation protein n=1 Tax=Planococcus sp. YIM B11945 TaxID=3435410 RepID=UPI003D7D584B
MATFDKVRSSAGIGNAKVDTYVHEARVKQGETVSGDIIIVGGENEQPINAIYVSLMTSVVVEQNGKRAMENFEIQRVKVSDSFSINPGEEKTVPFAFDVSLQTPLTVKRIEVWLKTALDVRFECEPKDNDLINVTGSETAKNILMALQQMDFAIKRVFNIKSRITESGIVQEFEFYAGGDYQKNFKELELVMIQNMNGVTVFISTDNGESERTLFLAQRIRRDDPLISVHYNDVPSVETVAEQLHDLFVNKSRK